MSSAEPPFESLAEAMAVFSSVPRLRTIHQLRTPLQLHEIRVPAGRSVGDEREGRPMARQSVRRHLDILLEAGVVRRMPEEAGDDAGAYVLNHQRLFALLDELRGLVKLRPRVEDTLPLERTLPREGSGGASSSPSGPRLVVAYGRDDGAVFPLDGQPGTCWSIGRGPSSDIVLDYDPYASTLNTFVERRASGVRVRDAGGRNGTAVNGERLPPEGTRDLVPGDLIRVGRTTLVYQP